MSIAVGPSQPPSNAGSPFISPRSTPVSMCRSRHSSGQSTYSTSRHTPFQSFDSGVSSVSSSPFISPQPTPVPVSTVLDLVGHIWLEIYVHLEVPLLSPLVSEQCPPSSFTFPSGNEVRSRHNSGSNTTTPLSPVSEHASSSSSCTSNLPDLSSVAETASILSHSFINDGAADLFINGNQSNFKQVRQRHASSSLSFIANNHILQ
ncbi:DNA-binding protein Rfx5 [Caerostris extrusa]|uniref:DNA-binding protein Rfx5 n=1 Tax=Caerostris extrusa TaxID=172846 RepID=A0AAV4NV60_CAEEX|nr:DNA-binding protein Rfx5 [Caerostris extrusa]